MECLNLVHEQPDDIEKTREPRYHENKVKRFKVIVFHSGKNTQKINLPGILVADRFKLKIKDLGPLCGYLVFCFQKQVIQIFLVELLVEF